MIPLFVMAVMQAHEDEALFRIIALALFVVMVIGDGVDGFVARRLNQRTVMGAFLDPVGDKLMMFSAYVFLAAAVWPEPRLPRWVSIVVISRDVFIGVGFVTLFVFTGRFRMVAPSGIGKLCTVVQAGTIVAVLAAPWLLQLAGTKLGLSILAGMGFFTVFITLFSGVDYLYAAHLCLADSDEITLTIEDRPGRE